MNQKNKKRIVPRLIWSAEIHGECLSVCPLSGLDKLASGSGFLLHSTVLCLALRLRSCGFCHCQMMSLLPLWLFSSSSTIRRIQTNELALLFNSILSSQTPPSGSAASCLEERELYHHHLSGITSELRTNSFIIPSTLCTRKRIPINHSNRLLLVVHEEINW